MNPRRWAVVAAVAAVLTFALLAWRANRHECSSWQGAAQIPEGATWTQCGDGVTRKLACADVPQPPPGKNRPTSNAPSPCTCFVDGKTTSTFQLDNAWDALASVNSTTETANARCGWDISLSK